MPNSAPTLRDFAPTITLAESTVNAAPQLLDADVTFTDPDNNFDGGTLVVAGLLAEDVVSIRDEGLGAELIQFDGGTGVVSFSGVQIGTTTGGVGGTFTVTFNADATSAAIEALIENLTYTNLSDTPTASRNLTIEVTDAAGAGTLGGFTEVTGASNPLSGIAFSFWSATSLGDLDGDGDLDVVVGTFGGGLAKIINTGTATAPAFGAPISIGISVQDYAAPALGDLDGDGDLDMVVGNEDGLLFTVTNTGDSMAPAFAAPVQIAGIDVGYQATPALGDLDGDGDLDIVVGESEGRLFTITNNGSVAAASFAAPVQIAGLDIGVHSVPALGDLDGDGDLDIVVGEQTGPLGIVENTGSTAAPVFGAPVWLAGIDIGKQSTPALGDLDGDGDLDIISGHMPPSGSYPPLHTILGSADPQITVGVTAENDAPATEVNAGLTLDEGARGTITTALLDFDDLDNTDDAITYTLDTTTANGTLWLDANDNGTRDTGEELVETESFTQADIGAGRLRYAHNGGETTSDGFRFDVSDGAGGVTENQSFAITVAPVNDAPVITVGTLDIVLANPGGDNVGVLLGNGAGGSAPRTQFEAGDGPRAVALGDLDGDGDLDIVTANIGGDNVSVLLGNGVGGFAPQTQFAAGDAPRAVALGDLDGDGDLDIVTANLFDKNVSVLLGDGDGGFGAQTLFVIGARPYSVALGDLDGDGNLDIVTANYEVDNVSVLLGDGNGGFAPRTNFAAGSGPCSVAFGDLDGDGDLDIVAANVFGHNVSVLLGDGNGGFAAQTLHATGYAPISIALGDIDRDGDLDIVAANRDGHDVSVLLGNGAGGFASQTRFAVGDGPRAVSLGDLDGDGDLDVVTANFFGVGSISLLLSDGAGGFAQTQLAVDEWSDSVALGNLDTMQLLDEDSSLVFGSANSNKIVISDVDANGGDETVTLSVLHGALTLATIAGLTIDAGGNGTSSITVTGTLAELNAALDGLVYEPAANFNGNDTLEISVNDNGNSGSGGPRTAATAVAISVTAVNDAPVLAGLDNIVAITEGDPAVDLDSSASVSDVELDSADDFNGATLTLSRQGGANTGDVFGMNGTTASLSGADVMVGATVVGSVTTNAAGTFAITFNGNATGALVDTVLSALTYQNTSDTPPASLQIQYAFNDGNAGAQGSGGAKAGSGAITVNVTPVNDAPTLGANTGLTLNEGAQAAITSAKLDFNDVEQADGAITYTLDTTTTKGTLWLDVDNDGQLDAGEALTATETFTQADIGAGRLRYTHNGGETTSDSFQFDLSDGDGGTVANQSFAIAVTPVNDAPSGTSKTVTAREDVAYALKAVDFGFSDVDGNGLGAVRISTLPGMGNLTNNGVRIATGQLVSIADINSGKLKFLGAKDANGITSFTFQVKDTGGTTNGGIDLDQMPNKLTINVTPVLDVFTGTAAANTQTGTNDGDLFRGLAGNDRINGLGGDDDLFGGLGADRLTGGAGKDVFFLNSISDSARSQSGLVKGVFNHTQGSGLRDIITDFTRGQDDVDLSAIDANTKIAGNQKFAWKGTGNFTNAPGQLIERLFNLAGTANDKTIVYGDVNGDGKADFQIEFTGLKVLVSGDFVL